MNEKQKEIEGLVIEKLGIKEIDPNATIVTYGLDSLDVAEFLLDLEDQYNISFSADDTKGLKTVGDLLNVIFKKLGD